MGHSWPGVLLQPKFLGTHDSTTIMAGLGHHKCVLSHVLFEKGIEENNREVGKTSREEGQVHYSL